MDSNVQKPDHKQNGVNNIKKYSIFSFIILVVCIVLIKSIFYQTPNERLKQELDEKTREYLIKDFEEKQKEQNIKEQQLNEKTKIYIDTGFLEKQKKQNKFKIETQQEKDEYINRMIEGMKNMKNKK